MFPPGLYRLALRLLLASVTIAGVVSSYRHDAPGWLQGTAILLCHSPSCEYRTLIVSVVALVVDGFVWAELGLDSTAWAALISLDAVAMALLGPGAFSVDAGLFGRGVVVLPPP